DPDHGAEAVAGLRAAARHAVLFRIGVIADRAGFGADRLELAERPDLDPAGRHRHDGGAVAILVDPGLSYRRSVGDRAVRLFAAAILVPVRPGVLRRSAR